MKRLILALCLFTSTAFAADPAKVGFKAYSSANSVSCGVFGMKGTLSSGFQGMAPVASMSRTLTLGTKGYANYSTTGRGAIQFTCRVTGTNTLTAVKVQVGGYLNGTETHFLTLDTGIFVTQ